MLRPMSSRTEEAYFPTPASNLPNSAPGNSPFKGAIGPAYSYDFLHAE
jgi:hypothetical protein